LITEVKAYSAWTSAPLLPLVVDGRPETDLIQIRNIDGLDPVKASISTTPYGSVDGASYTGSNVPSRNIVLTLHPNPDWDVWSVESLRKLIYQYFMPKLPVRLVIESDDIDPVEISGIVESAENNMFSKDPEIIVSIICPDPYFKAVTPIVVTGQAILAAGVPTIVDYNGNIQAGIGVKVTWVSGPLPNFIEVKMGNADASALVAVATVDANKYFEMSSVPMRKFSQNINIGSGVIDNLLSQTQIEEGFHWPHLHPGENEFSVITDQGVQDWELTYFELFGGL
jgi:hypothetical protein